MMFLNPEFAATLKSKAPPGQPANLRGQHIVDHSGVAGSSSAASSSAGVVIYPSTKASSSSAAMMKKEGHQQKDEPDIVYKTRCDKKYGLQVP